MLDFDDSGEEVLVGLTREESEWLLVFLRDDADKSVETHQTSTKDPSRANDLLVRHRNARLARTHASVGRSVLR